MVHRYTQEQTDFLTKYVAGRSATELTELFNTHFDLNLKPSQIRAFKKNRRLKGDENRVVAEAHQYTPEHIDFITQHVAGRSVVELTELFNSYFGLNLTTSQIKSFKTNRKLKQGNRKVSEERHQYTQEQIDFLTQHTEGHSTIELTELFNSHFGLSLKPEQIKGFKKNRKLSSGLDSRFKQGHVPVNKGKKGGGWEPTQFKKGHRPYNYMPVGSERVNTDGYVDVKIADPNKWRAKHRLIWEEVNGPVPEGHVLIFGDGNRLNVSLDNLILITQRQLSVLNAKGLIRDDIELTKTGINIADVYLKIGEITKVKKKGAYV